MTSKISGGVKVSVESFYQPDYSNPVQGEFIFTYQITIENNNSFPIRLLRRHWHIYDSNGSVREVEGDGVVGIQPLISPSSSYQYVSNCNLRSEIGKMLGTYTVENVHTLGSFTVAIPPFILQAPLKMN